MAVVHMRFYAELNDLLAPHRRGREFRHTFVTGASAKDVVEGLGVPHTEVDLLLVDGESVDFSHKLVGGERVAVYPMFEALDIQGTSRVRAQPLRRPRFAADVHLGKLASYLRLSGFDTLYENDWDDADLVEVALREGRTILTRDRGVLMRSAVTHGYLVKSTRPRVQLLEILERFDLWNCTSPLSRCSVCNRPVESVDKQDVLEQLPPGTRRNYNEFWRCSGCGRIYWRGAHYRALCGLVGRDVVPRGSIQAPAGEEGDSYEGHHSHGGHSG